MIAHLSCLRGKRLSEHENTKGLFIRKKMAYYKVRNILVTVWNEPQTISSNKRINKQLK